MPLRLAVDDPRFSSTFERFVRARRSAEENISVSVAEIIRAVRENGDAAVREYTLRWDHHDLDLSGWSISRDFLASAFAGLDAETRGALELAARRIEVYHSRQRPTDEEVTDDAGVVLGSRWGPIEAAGLYVPGGRAAYPSSVLMNAIPAKVAGVGRLVMMTPSPNGIVEPLVLAAAHLAGVDEVWRIGGAQAIAALAYGTARVCPVDVITGPGNAWVAEAKRQVYGVVGIDMVAGPSEIVIVADGNNNADWIAADLMSQAEHDPVSQSVLFTDDPAFADAVCAAVEKLLETLETRAVARAAWSANGAIFLLRSIEEAAIYIDQLAPEHLQIATENPREIFNQVTHAGSVFLGRYTPEAIGDYVAGPNHVLPTGRRARFSSGLSVLDFMKRTSFIELDQAALTEIGHAAVILAGAEGLPAHARSVGLRLGRNSV